jgi:hypothetical protein
MDEIFPFLGQIEAILIFCHLFLIFNINICYDIPLLRGWLVAGLPLICTKRAEH